MLLKNMMSTGEEYVQKFEYWKDPYADNSAYFSTGMEEDDRRLLQ